MAYVGQGIKGGTFSVLDTSGNTYNGSNVTFNLGTQVGSPAQLLVSHDGVIQKPVTDYTIATGGTQITFTTAPASGASIFITEISGAVGAPMNRDINGDELILDADGDTSITADTDDQIDIRIAGADDFQFTANTFTAQSGSTIAGQAITATTVVGSGAAQFATAGIGAAKDLGDGLHVKSGDSGASVDGAGNELVLENSGACGLSILSANDSTGNIYFGDDGANSIGYIQYSHVNNQIDFSANAGVKLSILSDGDIRLPIDEKGLVFGAGSDVYFGSNEGESGFIFTAGAAFAALNSSPGMQMLCEDTFQIQFFAGEGKGCSLLFRADQSDDNADRWYIGNGDTSFDASTSFNFLDYEAGSVDMEMALLNTGVLNVEGAVNASTSVDYAEYFEWKTELASDDKITETYGMTVVLDSGKVRLAEVGEEAKVLGVVRPNDVSAMVGGSEEFKYKDKYEKNVWNENVMEEYTLVKWDETINKYWKDGDTLPENVKVGDVRGTYVYQHEYHKDRIPAKKLKSMVKDGIPETQIDRSEPNWHTLASNLSSEDLVVPSTNAEKTAANYVERTTYSKDKGDYKKDDKLMRKKVNSSYDSTKVYVPRSKRRKEWCVVGLIGQVEVRDSAIVPTSWTKMKNLESGIDLYYIK